VPVPGRAVFLDRDGVLNRALVVDNVPHPPQDESEVEILPGVSEALGLLAARGFRLIVVTNQPDVSRGTQSRAVIETINHHLTLRLPLDEVLVCYHDMPAQCECRKPKAGLLLTAAQTFNLDLARSFMIGDRWSDVVAGATAGCTTFLLDMPYSDRSRCAPDYTVASVLEASHIIVALSEGNL
jgi:D-glycero-D-manno-heptose 1,7-bisphosphate phosphatase